MSQSKTPSPYLFHASVRYGPIDVLDNRTFDITISHDENDLIILEDNNSHESFGLSLQKAAELARDLKAAVSLIKGLRKAKEDEAKRLKEISES